MASYVGNYLINAAFPVSSQASAILDETPRFKSYTKAVLNEFPYLNTRPTPGPGWVPTDYILLS